MDELHARPQHQINQVWRRIPRIPQLRGWGKGDQKSKVILSYTKIQKQPGLHELVKREEKEREGGRERKEGRQGDLEGGFQKLVSTISSAL